MNELADLVVRELNGEIARGEIVGAQFFVARGGIPLVDVAVGRSSPGRRMLVTTQHNLWCATKCILALGFATEFRDELSGSTPLLVQDLWPDAPAHLGELQLIEILNHRAGLGRPSALDVTLMTPPDQELAHQHILPQSGKPEYSEWAGWWVLRECIKASYGCVATFLRSRLPQGTFWSEQTHSPQDLALGSPELGTYWAIGPRSQHLPFLHDLHSSSILQFPYVVGGFASVRSVARLLWEAHDSDVGRNWISPQVIKAKPAHDQWHGQARRFAAGLWAGDSIPGTGGRFSNQSWGTTGWEALSGFVIEPPADLAIGWLRNTISSRPETDAHPGEALVDQVATEMGL